LQDFQSAIAVELMTVHAKWLSLMVAFGNKTIDLKEIVDEALENVRVGESFSSKRIQFNIMMLEGREWCNRLDQASDNNVAEIMDAEDPLLYCILLALQENQKGIHVYGSTLLIRLRMYLIMKKMIFFGVPLILVGLLDIYILYGPLLNGATIVIFLASLRILIIVVLK
jgi:acetyl-CoA synthetase